MRWVTSPEGSPTVLRDASWTPRPAIWLVMGEDWQTGKAWTHVASHGVDLVYACYKTDCVREARTAETVLPSGMELIHIPGTSWTEGRNRLLSQALRREEKLRVTYQYFIFSDDDVSLTLNKTEGLADRERCAKFRGSGACADPRRAAVSMWEAELLEYLPAVGIPAVAPWPTPFAEEPITMVGDADAMTNAIHRAAAASVLPYITANDASGWWSSQASFIVRAFCHFGHMYQFNRYKNGATMSHRPYPRESDPWGPVFKDTFLERLVAPSLLSVLSGPFFSSSVRGRPISTFVANGNLTRWWEAANRQCYFLPSLEHRGFNDSEFGALLMTDKKCFDRREFFRP